MHPDTFWGPKRENPRGWPSSQGSISLLNSQENRTSRSPQKVVFKDMNYLQVVHDQHSVVTQVQELNLWNQFLEKEERYVRLP